MDANKLLKYSCFLGAISKAWFLAFFLVCGTRGRKCASTCCFMSLVDISSGESFIPLWVTVTVTPSGIKKVVEEKRLIRNKYRIACPRLCATAQSRECHFVF